MQQKERKGRLSRALGLEEWLESRWEFSGVSVSFGLELKKSAHQVFLARDSIQCRARYMLSPVRLSVWHWHTGGSVKMVKVRIMQFLPYSSSIPLVFVR